MSFGSAAAGKSIDFSESKAIPANGPWIYVNLKGRYTHGIVDAEEYEEIQNRIIKALYEYTDPLTGMKPVALALKKEDARLLGLYGDRIGDVVYAVSEYYGGSHGQLPTAKYGVGSLRGLLIMAGDGLKKGCVLKRTIHATDIVPTICYLTGLPLPRNAEGGIIYQALQADATEHTETWKSEQKSDRPPDQPFGAFQVES